MFLSFFCIVLLYVQVLFLAEIVLPVPHHTFPKEGTDGMIVDKFGDAGHVDHGVVFHLLEGGPLKDVIDDLCAEVLAAELGHFLDDASRFLLQIFVLQDEDAVSFPMLPPTQVVVQPVSEQQAFRLDHLEEFVETPLKVAHQDVGAIEMVIRHEVVLRVPHHGDELALAFVDLFLEEVRREVRLHKVRVSLLQDFI